MFLQKEIQELLGVNNLSASLIIIFLSLVVGMAIHFVFYMLLRRMERKSEHPNIHVIRIKTKISSFILIIVMVLLFSSPVLKNNIPSYEYLHHFLVIVLILNLGWLAMVGIDVAENLIVARYDMTAQDNLKARKISTQMRVFERILTFLVMVITISAVLMTFESIRQLGASLLASAGIAGLILGFAAQKSIANILAGIQIALTQPIRLDDVVIVEGEWGWIEEIRLTYVVVRIWDLRRLVVPINYFIEKPFQNWTRKSSDILGTVFIYTDYHVPFDELRKELTRILENNKKLWDGKVNVLQVTDSTERTVEVRALVSSVDSPKNWDLRVLVREKLIEFIRENYPESLPKSRIALAEKQQFNVVQKKD